jgi:hypothetical protein
MWDYFCIARYLYGRFGFLYRQTFQNAQFIAHVRITWQVRLISADINCTCHEDVLLGYFKCPCYREGHTNRVLCTRNESSLFCSLFSSLKNAVFWDVAPCRHYVNRRFGGTYRLHLQGIRNPRAKNQSGCSHLLTLVHRSRISYTLKMEAIRSTETSVNKIFTRRHIPEDYS